MNGIKAFFSTVQYNEDLADNSWGSWAENIADKCRVPVQWVTVEFKGGTRYKFKQATGSGDYFPRREDPAVLTGYRRVLRIIAGLVLAIPGAIFGAIAMGVAYGINKEISLKHRYALGALSPQEMSELGSLIQERRLLATKKEECNPITCFFGTIICMLCYLICRQPA